MIRVEGIGKRHVDGGNEVWPVKKADLTIRDSTFVSIVGRSGSGKSTLLKMLGGLLVPTQGQVFIDDTSIYELSEKGPARYRSEKVGFIFQDLLSILSIFQFYRDRNAGYLAALVLLFFNFITEQAIGFRIVIDLKSVGLSLLLSWLYFGLAFSLVMRKK